MYLAECRNVRGSYIGNRVKKCDAVIPMSEATIALRSRDLTHDRHDFAVQSLAGLIGRQGLRQPRLTWLGWQHARERREGRPRIGHDADSGRVVMTDDRCGDVDVNQVRRLHTPATRRDLAEATANRDEQVVGQGEKDGARPARLDLLERLHEQARDVVRCCCLGRPLRHRLEHAQQVHLVERTVFDCGVFGRDLCGQMQNGHGVRVCASDRRGRVGRARAGGREADTNLAGCASVAVGHEASGLLVTHEHVADRRVDQRVVDRRRVRAGVAKHGVDAEGFERLDDEVGTIHGDWA